MTNKERPGKYVRDHYQVPAFINTRVSFTFPGHHRRRGKITGFSGQYLIIKWDGEITGSRLRFHPQEVAYLDEAAQ